MATTFRHFSRVFMGLVLLSMAGAASAQWEVVDKELNKTAEKILDNQKVGKGKGKESSGKEVDEPKEKLAKVKDDQGVASCAASTKGTPVSDSQKESCELIQRTLNSQYNYVVAMYEISAKRLEKLREIEEEREDIKDGEIGLLESNTNKLLALKALMDIDRQQMESAMFAYDKRIAYLTGQQTAAAKAAMAGKEPPKGDGTDSWLPAWIPDDLLSLGKTVAAGLVMKGAFETIKSDTPSGMKPLAIDKD
ncbi:hypothetical protein A7D16_17305 [Xanthomonas nasturtii]|nr:hypothetical protein [Xanthomonas nasturtii]OAX87131.1 hypothetical protein A7D16_17305 [Xanthomonas nasturtii]WVL55306.1 hypothetical protein M3O54_012645 [Xanthomonas nasturtii]